MHLLTVAVLVVLVFMALSLIVAIASPETGPAEKFALVGAFGICLLAAPGVRSLAASVERRLD